MKHVQHTIGRDRTVRQRREEDVFAGAVIFFLLVLQHVHHVGGDDDLLLENVIAAEDEIAVETERLALGEALGTLEPMHRRIVTLRYYKNMSQKEPAAALGLTQVKISREEKKIFAKLRKELCV